MASASSSRSATPKTGSLTPKARSVTPMTAGPSGTGSPAPQVVTDIYRPLASAITRPLEHISAVNADGGSASTSTDLPTLVGLDAATYSSRLSGKTVLLTDIPGTTSSSSALVTGRKRNRGDAAAKRAARAEQREREEAAAERGMVGARKRGGLTSRSTRIDYNSLLPLHHLHVRYMAQLCALPTRESASATGPLPPSVRGPSLLPGLSPESLQSKLVKADMTGARLEVRSAKNASLKGLSGLVVEETAGSFRLLGRDSQVRVVPKVGSQFILRFPAYTPAPGDQDADLSEHIATCPQIEVDILGTAFAFRSGDRAGRKFRPAQGGGGGSGWGEDYVEAEWTGVLREAHKAEKMRVVENKRRKRGKSRRKDPLVHGSVQVF